MTSMHGYGMGGTHRDFVAFGETLELFAALSALMG